MRQLKIIFLALIGSAQITCADSFVLYSGEIIKGVILSETASKITIEVPNEKGTVLQTNTLSKFAIQSIVRATKTPQSDITTYQKEQQIQALLAQGNFEKAIKTLEAANSSSQTSLTNTVQLLQAAYRQFLDALARRQKQINNANTQAQAECARARQTSDLAQADLDKFRSRYHTDLVDNNYYYDRSYANNDQRNLPLQGEVNRLKADVANAKAKVINCEDNLTALQKQLTYFDDKIADIQSKLGQNH